MKYVISDIHGCFTEYQELLERIGFRDEDELYVLGDVVDRGPEPIRVLQDMMLRPNVYPILGNHEYMALSVLRRLAVEITRENAENYLTADDLLSYSYWMKDGGEITSRQFSQLSREEKEEVLDYLMEFSVYEEVAAGGKQYVLVHAGIRDFQEERDLEDYEFEDFVLFRADYDRRYFSDPRKYLVTGHMPTMAIRADQQPLVYQEKGHIAIDCGCVFGGQLAAYCLDTGEIFYVKSRNGHGEQEA